MSPLVPNEKEAAQFFDAVTAWVVCAIAGWIEVLSGTSPIYRGRPSKESEPALAIYFDCLRASLTKK